MPVAVFCMFFTSQEINIKRSPNATKLYRDFFWTRRNPMGQSCTWGCPEGGTTHQPGAPRWVVPTSVASRTPSSPYKFTNIPKPFGVALDQKFHRRKASVSMKSNLDPVLAPCRRRESSPVSIFIISAATTMRRE